jgi:hypothetical protein
MGFFDRFASGKKPASQPAASVAPEKTAAPAASAAAPVAGGVLPRLTEARAKLDARDLSAAMAIYEEVLGAAGARPDVLVTISGDLGVHGHVHELIELIAPRYDAEKHGPATGLNLLQAYLVVHNADAAQHLLDILFALQRPELEERLFGFSNALADMMASDAQSVAAVPELPPEAVKISLVSISKPIWFYGLETLAPQLLPRKDGKLRRVAFAQCALPGYPNPTEAAARPEDALGRLSRGLPLWFAETFFASAGYEAIAAVGVSSQKHYALFHAEWVAENIRQLNESTEQGIDYVVTGALRNRHDDFELSLRIWEVKKFRELKVLATRWTPATADEELRKFHELVRGYMEWTALPAGNGLAYAPPVAPLAYVQSLGATLTQFLGEKGVLGPEQIAPGAATQLAATRANPDDARAQLGLVATLLRHKTQGAPLDPEAHRHASEWLATPAAQAADVSALALKLV